jgi:Protein of unknown function (DUF3150)
MENIAGIARAAVLVSMHISTYSGRKKDAGTQQEITTAKNCGSAGAASVYKNLFSQCRELDAITKFQARARALHYRHTLPWDDTGTRMLPTKSLMTYRTEMTRCQNEFDRLVGEFLDRYDLLVAAAAFQLGSLFDRSEYPPREQVAKRFSMETPMMPLPVSGDFRLDIEHQVQEELAHKYEARMAQLVAAANQDAWTRLHEVLSRMSERLVIGEDGKKPVFRDSLVTNAEELCDLLTSLNVANDPALEKARQQLEATLQGVTPKDLRESNGARVATKQKVDDILSAFDWGIDDDN